MRRPTSCSSLKLGSNSSLPSVASEGGSGGSGGGTEGSGGPGQRRASVPNQFRALVSLTRQQSATANGLRVWTQNNALRRWQQAVCTVLAYTLPEWRVLDRHFAIRPSADVQLMCSALFATHGPLLNPVLPAPLEPTARTQLVRGSERLDATMQMMLEVLRLKIGAVPTVLIFEDVDFVDSASWQLALALAESRIAPTLLIVTLAPNAGSEPASPGRSPPQQTLVKSLEHGRIPTTKLPLQALSEAHVASLVKDTLHVEHLQPAIPALVADKSGGNPLYAIEICRSLLASGSIIVDRAAATATIGVPELAMVSQSVSQSVSQYVRT